MAFRCQGGYLSGLRAGKTSSTREEDELSADRLLYEQLEVGGTDVSGKGMFPSQRAHYNCVWTECALLNDSLQKPDGSFIQRFSTPLDTVVPQLEANKDTGHFAYALTHLPAGTTVMAAGTWCTWPEWVKTWARVVGVPEDKVAYKHVGNDVFDRALPDGFGKEIGEMFEYSGDPGYDGGDANVLRVDDLRKVSLYDLPLTSID